MRETPRNIDKSVKVMEYLMAFMIPCVGSFPMLELWALVLGGVISASFIYFTAGKPPGFMQEWFYEQGITLPGLLPRNLKKLDR